MKPTNSIESLFGTRSRTRVLWVLQSVRVPLNASQIARQAQLSQPAVATALRELEMAGVVGSSPAGRARVHWIVRDNIYVQRIVNVAFEAVREMPAELEADLARTFSDLCESVVLFGSYARGAQTTDSDIDIVLVGTDAASKRTIEDRVDEVAVDMMQRWGAPISAIVYTMAEAAGLRERAQGGLYTDIEHDGIVVSGVPPREWGSHEGSGQCQEGVARRR